MIIGIDAGNYESKLVTAHGAFKFRSCLGEWREFNLDTGALTDDDIIYEYKGTKGFAGTLAEKESLFIREMAGDTKAHEDAVLRILIGIHRYASDLEHDIIVGQPIRRHKADKSRIVEMLRGKHTITVNGVTKTFTIRNVAVAPEGAGAYVAYRGGESKVRIVDVGSATVNCATVVDGRFNDRDSWTLAFGANSAESYDVERLVDAIIANASKRWAKGDCVRVCGGMAEVMAPLLRKYFGNVAVMKPMVPKGHSAMTFVGPTYANAAGFYEIARGHYGSK
ncbi:hypothetical protein DOE78_18745 [Bacillus sp. Y1]|nr:ParM/StbA family protein [Bacillus sp. Y1]AYA77322.1 hypothetical protein DOE78_18745 [Bacillus sp. Y1]